MHTQSWITQEQKAGRLPNDFKPLHSQMVQKRVVCRFPKETWLNDWFAGRDISGDDAPDHIATPAEIRLCRKAWDYRGILNEIGTREKAYISGLELFPKECFAEWLEWLFGEQVPVGFHIVPRHVVKLAQRLTIYGICQAANISTQTYDRIIDDPNAKQALDDALVATSKGQLPKSKAWAAISNPKHMRSIIAFARYSTLASAIKDGTITKGQWQHAKTYAAKAGCKNQLMAMVDGKLSVKNGVVPPNEFTEKGGATLFIPPAWMFDFQIEAINKRPGISTLRDTLPSVGLFQAWLKDWTSPDEEGEPEKSRTQSRTQQAKPAKRGPGRYWDEFLGIDDELHERDANIADDVVVGTIRQRCSKHKKIHMVTVERLQSNRYKAYQSRKWKPSEERS